MMTGSWIVFAFIPKPVTLVLVMGAIDAPLIGVLMITYAFLGRRYLPQEYRSGAFWCVSMVVIGLLYLALGVSYAFLKG